MKAEVVSQHSSARLKLGVRGRRKPSRASINGRLRGTGPTEASTRTHPQETSLSRFSFHSRPAFHTNTLDIVPAPADTRIMSPTASVKTQRQRVRARRGQNVPNEAMKRHERRSKKP